MSVPTHSVRNSMIDRERTWRLDPNALYWTDAKGEGRIAYSDIRRVRLIAYANTGGEQYQCTLTVRGQGKVKIRSHHYASLSSFEDRRASYAPFIRALLPRVASASPNVDLRAGSLGLQITWIILFIADLVIAGLLGLAFLGGLEPTLKMIGIATGALFALPLIWRQIGRNRGYRFDAANPPEGLIGV